MKATADVRAQALFSGDAGRLVLDTLLLERLKVWRGSRVLRSGQRLLDATKSNQQRGFSNLFEDGVACLWAHSRGSREAHCAPCACLLSQQSETAVIEHFRSADAVKAMTDTDSAMGGGFALASLKAQGASTPDEPVTCPRSQEQLQPLPDHP